MRQYACVNGDWIPLIRAVVENTDIHVIHPICQNEWMRLLASVFLGKTTVQNDC